MIPVGYSSTSEAAFLLSDEDCKKAVSGSETLHKKLVEDGVSGVNKISVRINQENENKSHIYYPQYIIYVGGADVGKFERNVYKTASAINTPVIN